MSPSHRIAYAALLVLGSACARPTQVELRLHACPLAGEVPVRVDLEIRGRDAAGTALPVLESSFDIEPGELADGIVTVGLFKPEGLVAADFLLTWHDAGGDSETVELLARPVPAVGDSLELSAEDCTPIGTSSSSGDDTSTGDSSTTVSSDATSSTSSSSGSSSSSDDSTSTTTDTTGTTGDDTSTGDDSTSTGDTEDSTGTTGEESMIGQDCGGGQYWCEHGGPGELGTMLHCMGGVWKKGDLAVICATLFEFNCPDSLGLVEPVLVGCNGYGEDGLTCVCQDAQPQGCDPDTVAPCGAMNEISLCVEEQRALAVCSVKCTDEPDGSVCVEE